MTDIIEKHSLLSDAQFGFRPGRSTLDAIYVLTSLIQKAKKGRKPYAVAFLDISKVYKEINTLTVALKIPKSFNDTMFRNNF